jgi:hypothetical protein
MPTIIDLMLRTGFDGIQPHNTVELELAYGYEPLYVGFEIYAVDQNNVRKSNYCGTFDLIRTTELENIGPAGVTRTKSQGPCTLTYKVNGQPVQQLDEGTYVTKQADMEVVRVGRVGTQVYAMINNRGPDNLITEPVRLITDWAIKCEDQKPIESSYIFSELRYVGSIMPQWVYIYRGVDDLYTYVNTQTGKDDLKTQGKNCYYELRVEVDPSVPGEPSERFYTDPNNSNNKVKIDLAKIEPMK